MTMFVIFSCMTERRKLKKELSLLKYRRSQLPRLIDCSAVYGDSFYTDSYAVTLDSQIALLEQRIALLPIEMPSENTECTHEFIAREYSSQPYGTCVICNKTIFQS